MTATRPPTDLPGEAPLAGDWAIAWCPPGNGSNPAAAAAFSWSVGIAPETVGAVLRAGGDPGFSTAPRRLDAVDWWYRCRFGAAAPAPGERALLVFDGLATVADVWLNGAAILHSENMFVSHTLDVTERLAARNELLLRFQSLDALLAARRPRPRWRAPMVEHQQLRWFRTTLLGRTPGWSPAAAAAVGPWRRIRLRTRAGFVVEQVLLRPEVRGAERLLTAAVAIRTFAGQRVSHARLMVSGPGGAGEAQLVPGTGAGAGDAAVAGSVDAGPDAGLVHLAGTARVAGARLWWPHTHGDQPLYKASVALKVNDVEHRVALGQVGFRTLDLSTVGGDFALSVNGVDTFCRGACWTPLDVTSLNGTAEEYRRTLTLVRDAGMNMLRLGGPLVYETDLFHDLCDELGILVWQDFMFANMDYPEDAAFLAGVEVEARQVLARWQGRPSLALLCGDSEGEQQAAMWGAPRSTWQRPLFREKLAGLCRELRPDVPYWPSSASGGDFPHQPNMGSTSYYGVGAYLRPLDDARRSEVRFASECLAFANVPEEAALAVLAAAGGGPTRVHTPAWKAGVPRDLGAGWDFDDVRDHYLDILFGVDAVALRSTDPDRYLALGRVTTGEVMEATFAEWRRGRSTCRGGLIWFLRDLVAGAGWGVLDVTGGPKAAYHYLRRILRPVVAFFSNEGLNGLSLHVVNERAIPWEGELRLSLYRDGELRVGEGVRTVSIPGRGAGEFSAVSLLEGFSDTTYAYRFGPPEHDVAVATLVSAAGNLQSEAFHFPLRRAVAQEPDLGIEAVAAPSVANPGDFVLTVRSRRLAQAVAVNVPGYDADDNYFNVAPGAARSVRLRRSVGPAEPRGSVQALNARSSARVVIIPLPDSAS